MANRENSELDKFKIFPTLLRKRAEKWMHGLDAMAKAYEVARHSEEEKRKSYVSDSSENYDSDSSFDDSAKKKRYTKSKAKKKKEKQRIRHMQSSSSESTDSSGEDEPKSHGRTAPKKNESKGKGVVSNIHALAKELGELKIQMVDEKKRRKSPSASHHGLWCSKCRGH
ncbi:hypothetical protein R1flu_018067 [Riccia fluitans]|uniref:Uncharacterized protein n=1 Tax=Riccia fluitans TaxID=41844 RepID=A0ABD1ZIP8_9MARC